MKNRREEAKFSPKSQLNSIQTAMSPIKCMKMFSLTGPWMKKVSLELLEDD